MKSLLGFVTLFSALTATSHALTCTQCMAINSASCTGNNVTCTSGNTCGAIYAKTVIDNVATQVFLRACISNLSCEATGTMTTSQGQLWVLTKCCNTDNCTTADFSFPANAEANGLLCPSCVATDYSWCYGSRYIQCTGNETKCLLASMNLQGVFPDSNAMRGCATQALSDLGSNKLQTSGLSKVFTFTSSKGTRNVQKVFLNPAVVGILLLKFFF
ncbi:phospholipase A2 inhibitor and Ly6/PLAUR domain-containing protein-like [Engystomops pustulosus]|uniref:phospholipase A2 inhibitor and Ly6/PLAUR domain-containing protein-like n=1 Tax=Engystomops pustulosus TaxID=76066 RepID=UPI003AFB385C